MDLSEKKKLNDGGTPDTGRLSIEERNELVVSHLDCIDRVMRRNRLLIQAAHLDRDDVYQNLAIRLIHAVERYQPGPMSMKSYMYGFHSAPYDLRNASVSLEALSVSDPYWESKYEIVA